MELIKGQACIGGNANALQSCAVLHVEVEEDRIGGILQFLNLGHHGIELGRRKAVTQIRRRVKTGIVEGLKTVNTVVGLATLNDRIGFITIVNAIQRGQNRWDRCQRENDVINCGVLGNPDITVHSSIRSSIRRSIRSSIRSSIRRSIRSFIRRSIRSFVG